MTTKVPPRLSVFISAGDPSAENHAVAVARLLQESGVDISSAGGEKLKNISRRFAGDTVSLETFGFAVSPRSAAGLLKIYRRIVGMFDEQRPSAALLVDFFGFNAKVGAAAKKRGIPVYYYIPPQVWASRYGRIKAIKDFASKVFVTLPFERPIYEKEGIPFESVGHPLVDTTPADSAVPSDDAPPRVGFFPGSRTGVVRRHVPVINGVASILTEKYGRGKIEFAVFGLSAIKDSYAGLSDGIERVFDAAPRDVARRGLSAAASVSGTIATELALMKIPAVIFYKVGALNAFLVRSMIKTRFVSLPNIISDEEIQPERLQENARPEIIAADIDRFISAAPPVSEAFRKKLGRVRELLGPPGAAERVAAGIINDLSPAVPSEKS